MSTFNSGGNSIEDQQLDAIKAVKGEWEKPEDLNLDDNITSGYLKLYKEGMDPDQLTLLVIDKWNKKDGVDNFKNPDQIKRARSYANEILKIKNPKKENEEAPEENKSFKEKRKELQERTDLSEEERTKEEEKLIDEQIREKEKKDNAKNPGKKPASKDNYLKSLMDTLHGMEGNMVQDEVKEIGKISTVALPWIPLPTFKGVSTNKDGVKETKITVGIQRLTFKARLRHHRLNRVSKRFNKIGDDPKKGLNYIVAMCKKREGGRAMAAMLRGGRSRLEKQDIMRNPKVFRQKVENQKKIFIDDITEGITREEETKIIDAIKTRIDYFAQQYYIRLMADLAEGAKKMSPKKK